MENFTEDTDPKPVKGCDNPACNKPFGPVRHLWWPYEYHSEECKKEHGVFNENVAKILKALKIR